MLTAIIKFIPLYYCFNVKIYIYLFSNANFNVGKDSLFLGLVMEEAVSRYTGQGWNSLGRYCTVQWYQ
jgi:hypothetical protein